jgi:hypothetical protein
MPGPGEACPVVPADCARADDRDCCHGAIFVSGVGIVEPDRNFPGTGRDMGGERRTAHQTKAAAMPAEHHGRGSQGLPTRAARSVAAV